MQIVAGCLEFESVREEDRRCINLTCQQGCRPLGASTDLLQLDVDSRLESHTTHRHVAQQRVETTRSRYANNPVTKVLDRLVLLLGNEHVIDLGLHRSDDHRISALGQTHQRLVGCTGADVSSTCQKCLQASCLG